MVATSAPNCDVYAARLSDPQLDISLKNTIIRELRDSFDTLHTSNYGHFLATLFPVFYDLLTKQSPVFVSNSPEQKLRSTMLDILHRLPLNETLKPYLDKLLQLCLQLIRTDNEDNGVTCLKIIMELHRHFKSTLEGHVQPFLALVREMYGNMGTTVRESFDAGETPGPMTPFSNPFASPRPTSPTTDTSDHSHKTLTRSMWSFKVLAECPVIVVTLCQTHKKYNAEQIPEFIPLIIDVLKLRLRQQEEACQNAEAKGQLLVGMCPGIKNRTLYHDFIAAQVKTLAFLAFSLRNFSEHIRPYQDSIPDIVVHLLQDCPSDASSTHKELIVALRHILATDFRGAFVSKIDLMLNERILVGDGVTSRETLRPVAFSTLADLVHHIRTELSPSQLARAIQMYSRNLHDITLASGIHSMCAKLLINLIDCIIAIPDKPMARRLLIQILETFTRKLQSLNQQFVRVKCQYEEKVRELPQSEPRSPVGRTDIQLAPGTNYEQFLPIQTSLADTHGDFVKDTRFLIKSLVSGIKNVVFMLKLCNPPPTSTVVNLQEYGAVARGFTHKEVRIFVDLLRAGIQCFDYYSLASTPSEGEKSTCPSSPTVGKHPAPAFPIKLRPVSKEEKELLEHFASVFIYVDPAIFQEVFSSQMEFLFKCTLRNTPLLTVPQFFLASDAVSQSFASICLAFLMKRIDHLGGEDALYTSVMIQLFKLVFMAVTLFPATNEAVLKPHIANIISSCLKLSGKALHPANFFHLLRALFRSIGGGRFELLYKEVLPLLQVLMESLNILLNTTHEKHMQDLFVEISHSVPVRLSVLLPYLSLLMRPLVLALEPGSELVGQGLRTLELCIDNLTQEFLDPIMAPVINDIMVALWKHLKPEPYEQVHSHTTVRILGKLGGRNRRVLQNFPQIQSKQSAVSGLPLQVIFHGLDEPQSLPLDSVLQVAARVLQDSQSDFFYQEKAFALVTAQLSLLVDWEGVTSEKLGHLRHWFGQVYAAQSSSVNALPDQEVTSLSESKEALNPDSGEPLVPYQFPSVSPNYLLHQECVKVREETLVTILFAVFSASTVPGLRERAHTLIQRLVRYYALWYLARHCASLSAESAVNRTASSQASTDAFTAGTTSDNSRDFQQVFVNALVRAFTSESPELNELGQRALCLFYRTMVVCVAPTTDHDSSSNALPTLQDEWPGSSNGTCHSPQDGDLDNGAPALRTTDPSPLSTNTDDNRVHEFLSRMSVFQDLASQFCSFCYRENYMQKLGGCRGIHSLAIILPLGQSWLLEHSLDFVKGLLYILKGSAATEYYSQSIHVERTTQSLFQIIRACWKDHKLNLPTPPSPAQPSSLAGPDATASDKGNTDAMEVDKPSPSEPTVQSAEGVPKDNLEATPLTKSDANSPVLSDAKPETTGSPKEKPDAGTSLEDSKASDGKQAEGAFPLTAKDAVTVKTEPEESDSGQTSASQPTSANDTTHSPRAPESGQGLSTQQAQNPPDEAEGDTPLDPETRHQRAKFNSLIVLLITELTNPNAHVREAAQACYELLSQLTGQSVTHLLIPVRERLLRPIFAKPLRALSPHMQIGNTDAITYCLSLHPSFLAISEPLVRLLNEALALADAEDQALVNRTVHSKGPGSLVTLRLVCLKLLSAAMANSEFTASRHNPMQARIISVFFKSLYSKSQEIVEVANRGLQHVLTQLPKLPKELLQTGLRPILMSLSDHRRLSVHGLEALARMLKLLNSYFKAEIGRKLLDHLQQLANPNLLADISSKPLQDIEEIKVIVAVLHVFHLLPPSANIFLPELVKITLQMEEQICRDTSSPFRAPLFQYLNQYPTESVRYFLEQLHDTRPTRLFVALLHSEEGSVLREQLMKDPGTLLASLGLISSGEGDAPVSVTADKGSPESSDPTGNAMVVDDPKPQASPSGNGPPPPIKDDTVSTKPPTDANADNPAPNPSSRLRTFFHAVDILHTLAVCQPKWFADQPAVVEAFAEGLRSPLFKERLTSLSESFALDDAYSCYTAAECLMSIIPHVPNRSQLVLELLPLCGPVGRFDVVALRQYYWETVCLQFSSTDKQAILSQFLDSLLDLSIPVDTKVRTLKFLINPMILASLQDKAIDPVLNDALMDQLSTKLWGCIPNKLTPEQRQHFTDYFVIEILQLTSIVVEYAPHLMNEAKKMVILFSWSFIKQDDLATKHSAYVLLARFIAAFETPPKICNQIFVALLRAHQSEARGLVRQALQCMTPMLPQRLPAGSGDGQLPTWVRWIKKILVEDGHGVLQMINIYQLLVRHYEMFYDHRDQFLPHIVNVLTKLNVVQSTTTEARTLAIDLVDLVLKWERMRLRQSTGGGNDTQGGSAVPSEHAMEEVSSSHSGPVVPQKRSADQISLDQPPYDERSPTAKPKSSSPQTAPNSPPAPARYLREAILNYLVRLICFSGDTSSTHNMVPRALILLQAFLSPGLWDDIPPKLTHFERVLGNPDITEATLGSVCNTLEVLHVLLERAHSEWWLRHIRAVSDLLTKVLHSDYPAVAKALFPILKCLYRVVYTQQDAMDEDNDNADSAHFINLVDSFITESLQNTANLYGALRALEAKSAVKPEGLDTFIPGLVKLVQKLTREHIEHPQTSSSSSTGKGLPTPTMPLSVGSSVGSQPTATTPGGATNPVTNEGALDSPLNLLIITLTLLKLRVSYLGDQRRWYLTSLVTLIDNSQSIELLSTILGLVREWVLDPENLFPTIKEKANLLVTMMSFEKRRETALTEEYLQLVEKIYSDPTFARSELTVRLEQAFLLGTCFPNPVLRSRFFYIFNHSISTALPVRLNYVIALQTWESLASYFWIQQALVILLGAVAGEHPLEVAPGTERQPPLDQGVPALDHAMDTDVGNVNMGSQSLFDTLAADVVTLSQRMRVYRLADMIEPLMELVYLDADLSASLWRSIFPLCWSALTSKQRHDLTKSLIFLLAKPYHQQQEHARPNVIQTLLDAVLYCHPMPHLSPQLVKFLSKRFNAWHTGMLILEKLVADTPPENPEEMEEDKIRGSMLDGLAELYWTLEEYDYFFGIWRRRASYLETNTALSYEQCDIWGQAQAMYEKAQTRARRGGLPFTESEYCLWEDHWIRATEQLQQWDILMDLAKHDSNHDLQVECAWRLWDWANDTPQVSHILQACPDQESPRHLLYKSFLTLTRGQKDKKIADEFQGMCNKGIQASLQQWYALPSTIGPAHIPYLHLFQIYVELQEAQQMYASLASTTAANAEAKSHDLKTSLQTWRERLPNGWDDIQLWSDLVAWRQHTFTAINKTCLPLIPTLTQQAGPNANATTTSFAYRGYHETAWIINRFAQVARKHKLLDVCVDSLNKIYTLPNIEIQEAFLKLKEQAQCYYENPAEWTTGLEVINNTNLIYFNGSQKAEFFSLKGMFLAKLNLHNEAKMAFSEAVQSDMASGRAWAVWGQFNDQMFHDNPSNISWGTHALSCYLHAAGIHKNSKSRRYMARILWLLSMDDASGSMVQVFDSYKGETPILYWNTFIPQLLVGLLHQERSVCHKLLILIAKHFPQAIHYHVRTAREEMMALKRQSLMQTGTATVPTSGTGGPPNASGLEPVQSPSAQPASTADSLSSPKIASGDTGNPLSPNLPTSSAPSHTPTSAAVPTSSLPAGVPPGGSQPWDYVEEIMRVLKTAFPLSATSIENMVEQIYNRLKFTTEEEIYRLLMALLNDAVQQLNLRLSHGFPNMNLTPATLTNLQKFADSMNPPALKEAFMKDFLQEKLTLEPYTERLRQWRDRFEYLIDRRPKVQPLEKFSHYLVEFEFQKYDEIEVPGQHQLLKYETDLVRIDHFLPEVTFVRGYGYCHRRISIRGHNGVIYPFLVQQPVSRQSRREERMLQMFRIFDNLLETQRESRRRELSFTLPIIVPLAPQLRIVQDDATQFTLQEVYEHHCQAKGIERDAPVSYYMSQLKHIEDTNRQKNEALNLKMDIFDHISSEYVPSVILRDYVLQSTSTFNDFWQFRKRFTNQLAAVTFMTYILGAGHRHPHKFNISRTLGNIWTMEMVPIYTSQSPLFSNVEAVPFRLTPNLQTFIQPAGVEGVFTGSLIAIARSLVEPELEMNDFLSIFVRDEVYNWQTLYQKTLEQPVLREKVLQNIHTVMTKAEALSCRNDREKGAEMNVPACQTVLDLISHATNPEILARMDCIWMPWL